MTCPARLPCPACLTCPARLTCLARLTGASVCCRRQVPRPLAVRDPADGVCGGAAGLPGDGTAGHTADGG